MSQLNKNYTYECIETETIAGVTINKGCILVKAKNGYYTVQDTNGSMLFSSFIIENHLSFKPYER